MLYVYYVQKKKFKTKQLSNHQIYREQSSNHELILYHATLYTIPCTTIAINIFKSCRPNIKSSDPLHKKQIIKVPKQLN